MSVNQTPSGPAAAHDSALARAVARFCLEGTSLPPRAARGRFPGVPLWQALAAEGSSIWLDTGDAEAVSRLWTREMTALTTNNTLLNQEVQKGIYDGLVPAAARAIREAEPGISRERLVREIAFVLNASHGLKLARSFDADVSVELHTALAHDAEASYQYGKRFHAISPERFIVKVPLTPEGMFAARRLVQDGIRVNFTLGFSARQNLLIAFVARPAFVNVFLGRLNSFVADHALGDGRNVGEKAVLASQRAVRRFNEDQEAEARGAAVRQIAASIRSGRQCLDLAGVDVLTIPTAAAEQFLALGVAPGEVANRTEEDPPVELRGGLSLEAERLTDFWETEAMELALEELAREDLDALTGDGLRTFLGDHGLGDLFPEFTAEEESQIAADGKIPVHARWQEKVRAGTASWDGIFTASALRSFAADQRQLDERIGRFL